MEYLKILAILAVAAATQMVFAGAGSATTITSGGSAYTGNIVFESEGYVPIDNPIATINCVSNVELDEVSHGQGVTAVGAVDLVSFTNCTNSWHVTVPSKGWLEFHSIGSGDGTITSGGLTIEATRFSITCRYKTESTDIGVFWDGEHGNLQIQAALPFHSGSALCGETSVSWTGNYRVRSPTNLSID
jgi:hypothetical protein